MPWVLYILLCNSNSYYTGITHNLKNRLISHRAKQNIGTKEFTKIELVYTEEYQNRREVEKREKQLKGWSKAKKKALIEGKIELLKKLSNNHEVVEDNSI